MATVEELRRRIAEMRGEKPEPSLVSTGEQVPVRRESCRDALRKGAQRCPSIKDGHQCGLQQDHDHQFISHACACEGFGAWDTAEQDWPLSEKPTVCGARVGDCFCERKGGHDIRGYPNHWCDCGSKWAGTVGKPDFRVFRMPEDAGHVLPFATATTEAGKAKEAAEATETLRGGHPVPSQPETPANRRPGCESWWDQDPTAERCESMRDGHQCAWDVSHAGVGKDHHHCLCVDKLDWPAVPPVDDRRTGR
jgi:hypothetical protein